MNIFKSKFLPAYALTFVNGLSFTMLIPVYPFLIKIYEQPEIVLGLLFATFSLFQFIFSPILGAISDKVGRKPILLITQLGTFLSWIILGISYLLPNKILLGFISLPILVIFTSRIVDGITGGNMAVAQALIADITTKEERTKIFGNLGAIMGTTMIIGPSLGALAMASKYSYLATAILGGAVSLITLGGLLFKLKETLPESKRNKELKITFKSMNVISGLKKWSKIPIIKITFISKIIFFMGFMMYTSIAVLYLIDNFGFSPLNTGFYMMFTGLFLIFHQSYSVKVITKKFGDMKSLIIGLSIIAFGQNLMGMAPTIEMYTGFLFFTMLGISTTMTTLRGIMSKNVDEKSQGEIQGVNGSIDALLSIFAPIIGTFIYAINPSTIFFKIAIFPAIAAITGINLIRRNANKNK